MTQAYREKEANDGEALIDTRPSEAERRENCPGFEKSEKRYEPRGWQLVLLIVGCLTIGAVMGSVAARTPSNRTDEALKSRKARDLDSLESDLRGTPEPRLKLCRDSLARHRKDIEKLNEKSLAEQERLKKQIDQLREELMGKEALLSSDQKGHGKEKEDLVGQVNKCNSTLTDERAQLQGLLSFTGIVSKPPDALSKEMFAAAEVKTWSSFGNCTYRFFGTYAYFPVAESVCQLFGAHLPSIHSKEENQFVHDLIRDERMIWIGLNRVLPSKEWLWTDKGQAPYRQWATGQPNEDVSDGLLGVTLYKNEQEWHDYRAERSITFVCKRCKA